MPSLPGRSTIIRAGLMSLAASAVALGCSSGSRSGGGSTSSASSQWLAPRASSTPATTTSATTTTITVGPTPAPSPTVSPSPSPVAVGIPASGLGWTATRPFPTFASATSFDVATLTGGADQRYLLLSLQGIVNRKTPRIYFDSAALGSFWLQQTKLPSNAVADPMTLVSKYASEVKGIVVYDDTQIDTVNLATTIAGIQDALVASPALAAVLTAAPYNLTVLEDLRANHFTSAIDVYKYELATYAAQTSNRMIVGLDPTIADCLRDYAVATQAAVVWLDPQSSAQTAVLDGFLSRLQTNAPYMGWWTQEQAGVKESARFGVPSYAANYAQNLSALAGVHVAVTPPTPPPPPALGKKAYVALFVSDGDNVEECQNWIPTKWADPNRGKVPISWTVQPAFVDLGPVTLQYYNSTATPNDVLVSGPSGLGYTYPGTWPSAALPSYTQASADALARAGLRVVTIWNDGIVPFTWGAPATVFGNTWPHILGATDQVTWAGLTFASSTLPVLGLATSYGQDEASLESGIDGQLSGWNQSGPLFIGVQGDNNQAALTPTTFLNVQQHYASNSNVVFVRADHLFQLIREANGLPINP